MDIEVTKKDLLNLTKEIKKNINKYIILYQELQRDLTDSTVLRNLGISFGYIKVAYENIVKGLHP